MSEKPKKPKKDEDLFDWSGESLRDQGISRNLVSEGEWANKAVAIALATIVPFNGRVVTIDTFRPAIEKEIGKPHKDKAWGALTMGLVRDKKMRSVPGKIKSPRRSNHARQNQKYIVTL